MALVRILVTALCGLGNCWKSRDGESKYEGDCQPEKLALASGATACAVTPMNIGAGDRNRTGDVQLGKLTMPRCAVIPCEKNRGVACDTMRRRDPL
jgi:hypothetical protein